MAAFTDQAFKTKLKDLNSTQQSIQTVSLWAIHHRRHHTKIVTIWMEELKEAPDAARKLTLLYLANDVIQNMRKKGPEYQTEFQLVMAEAYSIAARKARMEGEDKILKSLSRLSVVWRERGIFDDAFIAKLDHAIADPSSSSTAPASMARPGPISGKQAPSIAAVPATSSSISRTPPITDQQAASLPKRIKIDTADFQAFSSNQKGQIGRLEPHSDDEDYEEAPRVNGTNPSESPKLETLLRLVQRLQSAPSANGTIRSKIAALPAIITDSAAIDKLSDPAEIERLVNVSKDGLQVVMEYNKELNQELQDRQAVATELAKQLAYHRKIIDEKEHLREQLAQQISERRAFRDKLAIHVDSLPDMSHVAGLSESFTGVSSSSSLNRTSAAKTNNSTKHSILK